MSEFFHSLKQPDGSFLVTHHAEVDVRGIYCLIAVATLLDILTPSLISGTAAFIASCQTYEGGFASASQPYFSPKGKLLRSPRPALGEAHGGYTNCAIAAWVLLKPFLDADRYGDDDHGKPEINLRRLKRWLASIQGGASELGGFKGRTNKLVDGCYSWWCGGTFVMIEALKAQTRDTFSASNSDTDKDGWDDVDGEFAGFRYKRDRLMLNRDVQDTLFDRKALQEYILYAGQHRAGGLRDKPPKWGYFYIFITL